MPLKWTRFTSPPPNCDSETSGAAWRKQKPVMMPKWFRSTDALGLDSLQPVELPAGCTVSFRFEASMSGHLSGDDAAVFE
ncbi:hypothetical protein STEG23_011615 [Scotinomys teguina]